MTGHKLENANDELIMELAVSEMLEMFGRKLEEEYKNMNDIPDNPEAEKRFYNAIDEKISTSESIMKYAFEERSQKP